jgi:hypothetical protein
MGPYILIKFQPDKIILTPSKKFRRWLPETLVYKSLLKLSQVSSEDLKYLPAMEVTHYDPWHLYYSTNQIESNQSAQVQAETICVLFVTNY